MTGQFFYFFPSVTKLHNNYFFFFNLKLFWPSLSLGITIKRTAFFECLFFSGLFANTENKSSLSMKWVSFCKILNESVSSSPIYEFGSSFISRKFVPLEAFGMKERMSTFEAFSFLTASCFLSLLMYRRVEGRRGISSYSVSTWSLILQSLSFLSFSVPTSMTTFLD